MALQDLLYSQGLFHDYNKMFASFGILIDQNWMGSSVAFLTHGHGPRFLMESFISRCLDFMQKSIGYALIVIFQSDTKLKSRENLGWGEHGYLLHKVFQKSGVSHKFQASKSYFRTLSTWCASTSEPAHLLMMKPQFNYSKNWWYWSSLSSKILLLENQCQENYYQFLCISSLPHW